LYLEFKYVIIYFVKKKNLNKNPTPEVIKLSDELKRHNIFCDVEHGDGFKHIDIRVPIAHLDLEIDGSQHWTEFNQIISDLDRSYYSDRDGYRTFHIPNWIVNNRLEELVNALLVVIKKLSHMNSAQKVLTK
jgi:hypothetical protein